MQSADECNHMEVFLKQFYWIITIVHSFYHNADKILLKKQANFIQQLTTIKAFEKHM